MADGASLAALIRPADFTLPETFYATFQAATADMVRRVMPTLRADLARLAAVLAEPVERRPSGLLVPKRRGPRRESKEAAQERLARRVAVWCQGPPRRNPLHLDRAAIADATGYTPGSLDNLLDRHRLTQVEVLAPAWVIWNGKTRETRWV